MLVKFNCSGKLIKLIVYVDDIIVTGNDDEERKQLKAHLAQEFEIKDLGRLRYFLGMEIARNHTELSVSQRKYTLDLLQETGMLGCRPIDAPIDPNQKLGYKEGSIPTDKGKNIKG